MAMIYAIPVERFCSEADATRWNLAFLALVATWRVLLLARIISVLYRFSFLRAIWPVMLLADTLVIIAMIALPFPLLNLMGGIDTPESIQIINEARLNVFFLGVMTWLFWLIGFSLSALHPSKPLPLTSPSTTPVDVRRGPWIVFGVSLAAMLIACFFTQPEQQKAEKFRRLLLAGQPAQGIEFISQYTRSDLPPHWDAPPRLDYDAFSPNLFPILSAIATTPKTAPWVRDLYAEKLLYFKRKMQGWGQFWSGLSAQDVTDLITFLKSSPEILEKFEDATGSEWGDSVTIRCVVAELIEYKLILPGSSEPLPLELVRQLLDLDQERNERHCGTKEAIAAKLEAFRQPVAQEDNSLGPEQEDLSPLENTP